MDDLRRGGAERELELEYFCDLIRSMGAVGIPVLCYNWMTVLSWRRTATTISTRGGALVTAYQHEVEQAQPEVERVAEQELWNAFELFLEDVVPVAEAEGVRLALHPEDPPVSPIRGISRIMTSVEAF